MKLPGGIEIVGGNKGLNDLLVARGQFILRYCLEKKWDAENLTMPQILELRSQEGWKNPQAEQES